jgi:hypothetical protein
MLIVYPSAQPGQPQHVFICTVSLASTPSSSSSTAAPIPEVTITFSKQTKNGGGSDKM